jgi:hypothetical protein
MHAFGSLRTPLRPQDVRAHTAGYRLCKGLCINIAVKTRHQRTTTYHTFTALAPGAASSTLAVARAAVDDRGNLELAPDLAAIVAAAGEHLDPRDSHGVEVHLVALSGEEGDALDVELPLLAGQLTSGFAPGLGFPSCRCPCSRRTQSTSSTTPAPVMVVLDTATESGTDS